MRACGDNARGSADDAVARGDSAARGDAYFGDEVVNHVRGQTAEIVLDYGPWFFGGFGAIYGGGMAVLELLDGRGALTMPVYLAVLSIVLGLALVVPTAGYVGQSIVRHGHWGTRPVMKKCQSV